MVFLNVCHPYWTVELRPRGRCLSCSLQPCSCNTRCVYPSHCELWSVFQSGSSDKFCVESLLLVSLNDGPQRPLRNYVEGLYWRIEQVSMKRMYTTDLVWKCVYYWSYEFDIIVMLGYKRISKYKNHESVGSICKDYSLMKEISKHNQ